MALDTFKCNHLTPLHFKGLTDRWTAGLETWEQCVVGEGKKKPHRTKNDWTSECSRLTL